LRRSRKIAPALRVDRDAGVATTGNRLARRG